MNCSFKGNFFFLRSRCSSYNPLETPNTVKANCCTNCAQPFVYSFITFEVLPLVEFQLEPGLSEHEACRLLEEQPLDDDHWTQNIEENVQSMRISYDDHSGTPIHQDPFSSRLISFDGGGVGMINADDSEPIIATRSMLRSMDFSNTLICKYPKPLPMRFSKTYSPTSTLRLVLIATRYSTKTITSPCFWKNPTAPFAGLRGTQQA